jgi:EAL domain-containing protein (putative c-di-GMP-specific phosphodiesterase class I)
MTTERGDAALVRSAIDIGRHFGFHVVAEGVERAEVRDALVEAGCEAAQGYLFAAPMTAAALREWWTKHS